MASLSKKKYEESQKVKDAFDKYNEYKDTQKPADYKFSDEELLTKAQNDYLNAEKFSYNADTDPLYNQYKKHYQSQGKLAMEDSVGNASALTGGYGNSYAQTAGISAYNSYLDKLNNVLPELYSAAYSRYEGELDRLESKLGYLTDKNKEEYSRYLDSYSMYSDEVEALRDLYLQEYKNDMAIQDSEWESAYKIAMAEQEKELRNAELGYQYYAANLAQSRFETELAAKQAQFDAEMEYQKTRDQKDDQLRAYDLMLERKKIENDDDHFWAEYKESNKDYLREDELYVLLGNGGEYAVMSALDYMYDEEYAKAKALSMGIDADYVSSYYDAK